MSHSIGSYHPFEHDNFDFKKNVIELARKQPETFEGIHTAALIYVNAVDYIAQHLVANLAIIAHITTYQTFNGVVFVSDEVPKSMPLGKVIEYLNKYEFPDKSQFMARLNKFKVVRNRIVHNLLSLSKKEIDKLDGDFKEIKNGAEELLNRYDSITRGITHTWNIAAGLQAQQSPETKKSTPSHES